ncbi:hypothetical protein V8C26DRAFT_423360 [Trichoderma gracile]
MPSKNVKNVKVRKGGKSWRFWRKWYRPSSPSPSEMQPAPSELVSATSHSVIDAARVFLRFAALPSSAHPRLSTALADQPSDAIESTSTEPLPLNLSSAGLPSGSTQASELGTPQPPSAPDTPQRPPTPDLWTRAFAKANEETQKWIKKHGLQASVTQSRDQIHELLSLVKGHKLSEQNEQPFKLDIGNQKIIVRDYVADAVAFITMAGDAAMAFAPPQAGAPWAIAKEVVKIEQKAALLGTVQWFTRIVRRGEIYEALYTTATTNEEATINLYEALLETYIAALELLAQSDTLFESGVARQTLTAILRPDGATGGVKNLAEREQRLDREVQSCEALRSSVSSKQTTDGIDALKKQLDQLSSPLPRIDKSIAGLLSRVEKRELDELMNFISNEMFGTSHVNVSESRLEGTGEWLLASKEFWDWQSIPSSSAALCLKGTVGTGKTYLTSKVIDHVRQTLKVAHHDEGFAFFYCKRSGLSMQNPMVVLRSFVRQLAGKAFDEPGLIQSRLKQICETAKSEGRELGYQDCRNLILQSFNSYSKTTIVLDALDESDISTYNIGTVLIDLMEQSKKPVKIFISSRPDREYLEKVFGGRSIITVDAGHQQGDIQKFLAENLYSTPFFEQRSPNIQGKIREVFTERGCGMFRWVFLQVRSLKDHISDDAIDSWAHKLPLDLMGTYNQLWKNIQERDEADLALAERAIMWVLCSFEPLKINVLLEAIQYAVQGPDLILSLCQDLLTVDEVKGFFESKGWTTWNFLNKYLLEDAEDPEVSKFWIKYWGVHMARYDEWLGLAEKEEADPDVAVHLKRFLGSPAEGSHSYRRWAKYYPSVIRYRLPLLAICSYGIYHTLRDWWLGGTITEEMALSEIELGYTALEFAVMQKCMPMCRRLIELIDIKHPKARRHHTSALREALRKDKTDILEFLIMEAKADVNFAEGAELSAAQLAAMSQPDMLQWLIRQGVVDLEKEYIGSSVFGNILITAAAASNYQSVEILLRAGVNVNAAVQSGAYGSALVAAAEMNDSSKQTFVETVRLLLNAGADPNQVFEKGPCDSVLMAAAREVKSEHLVNRDEREEEIKEVLQLLLAAGADPTAIPRRSDYGSALAAAAFWGRKEMLQIMIDHVGEERAVDSLRRSKHLRRQRTFCDGKSVERWKQTATYLAEEVGISNLWLSTVKATTN